VDQKTIKAFSNWLSKLNYRPNTIKAYLNALQNTPDINLVKDDIIDVCGIINVSLAESKSKLAKSAFITFLTFLHETSDTSNPRAYEELRMKKNSIKANIEMPKQIKEKHDVGQYYVSKVKLVNALANLPRNYAYIILLLYDSGARINELLKNNWENVTEVQIHIPERLSKTKTERWIPWLMPESVEVIKKVKGKPAETIQKTLNLNYYSVWYELKKLRDMSFNPHALRHTILTDLAEEPGWEIKQLAERAGHEDYNTTKQYIDWKRKHKEQVMTLSAYCKANNINLMAIINGVQS